MKVKHVNRNFPLLPMQVSRKAISSVLVVSSPLLRAAGYSVYNTSIVYETFNVTDYVRFYTDANGRPTALFAQAKLGLDRALADTRPTGTQSCGAPYIGPQGRLALICSSSIMDSSDHEIGLTAMVRTLSDAWDGFLQHVLANEQDATLFMVDENFNYVSSSGSPVVDLKKLQHLSPLKPGASTIEAAAARRVQEAGNATVREVIGIEGDDYLLYSTPLDVPRIAQGWRIVFVQPMR